MKSCGALRQTYETPVVHNNWEAAYRGNPLQDRLNARIMERVLAAIAPAPEAHFLDAGCGAGYHSLAIAKLGYRCVGIDISEKILQTARRNVKQAGLGGHLSFRQEELESLSFGDGEFDVVHCRGVLMHIPQWERALGELCRVLKPGGSIVLMESNISALEACVVRAFRQVRRARSRVIVAPGGIEFWSEVNGNPFVVRIADMNYLASRLRDCGVRPVQRFATEMWDVYRFPAGAIRNAVIRINHLWFRLRLPWSMSIGNALIGRKDNK
jgi:2-polyprenyl-3-methyl-5-hydroxy-6-metoxy-1,4-benzoquinol methylase